MKTSHRIAITSLVIVALGGCTSMGEKQAYNPNREVDDSGYVAAVERTARTRGVSVRWVNVPQKRLKDLNQQ